MQYVMDYFDVGYAGVKMVVSSANCNTVVWQVGIEASRSPIFI
jgi:hypothetical protein